MILTIVLFILNLVCMYYLMLVALYMHAQRVTSIVVQQLQAEQESHDDELLDDFIEHKSKYQQLELDLED